MQKTTHKKLTYREEFEMEVQPINLFPLIL